MRNIFHLATRLSRPSFGLALAISYELTAVSYPGPVAFRPHLTAGLALSCFSPAYWQDQCQKPKQPKQL